jgi:hypothetical protein
LTSQNDPFPLFGLLNSGKKSIALNLKDAGGKEIFNLSDIYCHSQVLDSSGTI